MSGKRYPEEFKIEAVKQVVDLGHSISEVAKRLGMSHRTVFMLGLRNSGLILNSATN